MRQDHAAALDAVHAELELERDLAPIWSRSKNYFWYRPEPARKRNTSRGRPGAALERNCSGRGRQPVHAFADLQWFIGDAYRRRGGAAGSVVIAAFAPGSHRA